MSVYHHDWESSGFAALVEDFKLSEQERDQVEREFEILHAAYSYADYSGEAFVVLRSRADGMLWEVNGSHCSCYALENQWGLEQSCVEALRVRHEAKPLLGLETVGVSWLDSLFEARELEDAVPETHAAAGPRARVKAL